MAIFKTIPWASEYEISSDGIIRRVVAFGRYHAGWVLRPAVKNGGYPFVALRHNDGIKRNEYVHRIVAIIFIGKPPSEKHEVAHNNGNRGDVRVENLRWATRSENLADRLLHGTHARGEKSCHSKLTWEQVKEIRKSTESQYVLGKKYGVDPSRISRIRTGARNSWKPVECLV